MSLSRGKKNADIEDRITRSKQQIAAMTPAAREAMYAQQRDGYVKAEMSWPKRVRFTAGDDAGEH